MPYQPFANQEYRNFLQTHLEIPALLRAIPIRPGSRILEVGCGRGVALARLAKLCKPSRLTGLDIAPDLIEFAALRTRNVSPLVELRVGDVRALPFADAEFDVVIDFGTCYHIDNAEQALREIARVLAAGGRFIHETPMSQRIAHPFRSSGDVLPWNKVPALIRGQHAVLWASRWKS